MRKSYIFVVIFILLASILFFLPSNKEEPIEINHPAVEPEFQKKSIAEEIQSTYSGEALPQPALESAAEAEKFKEEMDGKDDPQRAAYLAAFETPIEYYGRVLDETGIPVVGAEVKFNALNNPYAPLSPGTQYTRLSDVDGNFAITGITGTRLTLNVIKEGYRLIPNPQSSVGYHPSSVQKDDGEMPTAEKPALLVMEKLISPTPLIKRRIKQKLPLDGQAVTIDLLSGKIHSNGSFTMSLKSDYTAGNYQMKNWQAVVKIQNGGLVEHTDLANFEAPESGYKNEIVFQVTEDMERKPKSFRQDYYFTTHDGQRFGRGTLYISSNGTFSFSYYLNPEGSRNLQYDRAMDITKQF